VIKTLSPRELDAAMPTLVEQLQESVAQGASLGFLAPLSSHDALDYWLSVRSQMESGARVVLAAYAQERVIGSGQLSLAPWSNGKHRAIVEKMIVSTPMRGRGIGKALLNALLEAARLRGRSLLLINARRDDPAERLYKSMGFKEFGIIPGYTIDADGRRQDNVCMYRELPLS
jgi:ribosomal protein S18 acetylase RimI-like enzyme